MKGNIVTAEQISNLEIVTKSAALSRLSGRISRETLLACDLEADSLHHYQERVCLIQISTQHESALVDPLACSDLSALAPVMADPAIRKIFHGADYDIRSLHRDFGIEVRNLFDTMIACQFLGEREVGLAAVLKKRFGAELDKRYQKADWSKRPLSPGMVEYAVKDTALLIALYGELVAELAAAGRLAWVEEENELLSRVRASARDGEMLSLRFKGASRMDSRTLAVLEELLRFRDARARQNDLPPFKVLGAETLAELAHKKPAKSADLSGVVGMTPKLIDRYGNQLLDAVARGMALPANRLPSYPRSPGPVRNPCHDRLLKQLKLWRDGKSRSLGVDAGLLANNTLLEALCLAALENRDELETLPMLKRWQNEVFGGELKELLIKAWEQARTL